jgi:hypothetical protein
LLFGINEKPAWADLLENINIYNKRIPHWYFPIGIDSIGNLFLISMYYENCGVIAFWDHEMEASLFSKDADEYFDNLTWIANSFGEFTQKLE